MAEEKESSVLNYLKEIGIARERGGAVYEKALARGGSLKGASIKMAEMINKTMRAKETEVVTIPRRSLPFLFGMVVIEPPEAGKPPKIKANTREYLRARGIEVRYSRLAGLVDFMKIEEKKY